MTPRMAADPHARKMPPNNSVGGRPLAEEARPPVRKPTMIIAAPRRPVARGMWFLFTES